MQGLYVLSNMGPLDRQPRERLKALNRSPQETGNQRFSKRKRVVGLFSRKCPVKAVSHCLPGGRTLTVLLSQGLVNEVCSPFKVGAKVELLRVVGLDTQVGDAGVLVEVGTGVYVHEGPALSSIQDVGDAQFLQLGDVLSHRPGQETSARDVYLTNWQPQGRTMEKLLSLLAT